MDKLSLITLANLFICTSKFLHLKCYVYGGQSIYIEHSIGRYFTSELYWLYLPFLEKWKLGKLDGCIGICCKNGKLENLANHKMNSEAIKFQIFIETDEYFFLCKGERRTYFDWFRRNITNVKDL